MANQLKKFTFGQFLKVKIAFSDIKEDKKSTIDLIESHGKIGLTVLTRMNIKTENSDSSPLSNEMLKKNKERAKKIKLQIMNNFAQKQKSFQSTSDSPKSDIEKYKTEKMHNMDCSV